MVLDRARAVLRTQALPAARRDDGGRDGQRRARLPARGRQPALPPRGAGGAGRLRARVAVRLQGRRDPGDQGTTFATTSRSTTTSCRAACSTPTGWTRSPFTVDDFDVEWLPVRAGMARGFEAQLRYQRDDRDARGAVLRPAGQPPADDRRHRAVPDRARLRAGGHRPRRRGQRRRTPGRSIFLPQGPDLFSFGVVKAPDAKPDQIGLEGYFFPTFGQRRRRPGQPGGRRHQPAALAQRLHRRPRPRRRAPRSRSTCWTRTRPRRCPARTGSRCGSTSRPATPSSCRTGWASVTFEEVVPWQRIQISQTPGKEIALLGVVLALLGLMGSLFIRSRRVWVRVDRRRRRHARRGGGPRPLGRRRHRRRTLGSRERLQSEPARRNRR